MKKIFTLLITLITLQCSALDLIGYTYGQSIDIITNSHIKLLDNTTTTQIETLDAGCIITYYYQDDICTRIDYLIEEGFYRDNLLRIRLKDCPYSEYLYTCCDNEKKLIVSVFKLPYKN